MDLLLFIRFSRNVSQSKLYKNYYQAANFTFLILINYNKFSNNYKMILLLRFLNNFKVKL